MYSLVDNVDERNFQIENEFLKIITLNLETQKKLKIINNDISILDKEIKKLQSTINKNTPSKIV